jgi:alpha-ketoglutaric semialdehyde dehydrogenase
VRRWCWNAPEHDISESFNQIVSYQDMNSFHGHSLIDGGRHAGDGGVFRALCAQDQRELPGVFHRAGEAEAGLAMAAARRDFPAFRAAPGAQRAGFLELAAERLAGCEDALIDRIRQEAGLTEQRIRGELGRTLGQLRMYAGIARGESWRDPRIETAMPDRQPVPKPDLRRMLVPIGPVVVFGSSNFPLAYSVAGGDTVSALAVGNPVVVKAHSAHPGASEIVGEALAGALRETGLPAGAFAMLHGEGARIGIALVRHPEARAVGFTGSYVGGRALIDAAAARPDPIPVFAEMSGLNPVVLLPGALRERPMEIAAMLVESITLGMGQFCTKPGLLLLCDAPGANVFRDALAEGMRRVASAPLLHRGIADSYAAGCGAVIERRGITVLARAGNPAAHGHGAALLVETDAQTLLDDPALRHEVFGPFSMIVRCTGPEECQRVLRVLGGQLTASVFGGETEIDRGLLDDLTESAGRVVANGVPTGVEVCDAIQHGGPWPAASDSRFGSVGPRAFLRFVRPVAFQNLPDALLPAALQNANPLGLVRQVNGVADAGSIAPT